MKSSVPGAALSVSFAVLVVAVLGGCAPAVGLPHHGTKSPTPSTSAMATPTSTSTPGSAPGSLGPLPANALFRISATATASDGAVADLVETVFAPSALTAANHTLLDSQCNYPGAPDLQGQPTWEEQYPSPLIVSTTITSTLRHGSHAWSASDEIVFGFLGTSAYAGDFTDYQADCSPGLLLVPGVVHGVAPVPSSDPIDGDTGWASGNGIYGFGGGGADSGQQDLGGSTIISDCVIEVSQAAKTESSVAQGWATHGAQPGDGCTFAGPSPA